MKMEDTIEALREKVPSEAFTSSDGSPPPTSVAMATKRFLRAQIEHAGLDWEEVSTLFSERAEVLGSTLSDMTWDEGCNQIYSFQLRLAIEVALTVQGLAPAEVSWHEDEKLDTSLFSGGYIHGGNGETVRVAGQDEEGAIVVHFNADQPHQREERWCVDHFHERFIAVEDVPIIGGGS